jgi:hypothetical protein
MERHVGQPLILVGRRKHCIYATTIAPTVAIKDGCVAPGELLY